MPQKTKQAPLTGRSSQSPCLLLLSLIILLCNVCSTVVANSSVPRDTIPPPPSSSFTRRTTTIATRPSILSIQPSSVSLLSSSLGTTDQRSILLQPAGLQRRWCNLSHASSSSTQRMLSTRGGGGGDNTKKNPSSKSRQSSSDESDDEETLFHIETQTSVLSSGPITTFFSLLGRAVVRVLEAGKRAVDAGIDAVAEEYEDEDEVPVLKRVMDVLKSMVYAALRVPATNDGGGSSTGDGSTTGNGGEDEEDDGDGMDTKRRRKRTPSKKTQLVERGDFGLYLSEFYDVPLPEPTHNEDEDDEDLSTVEFYGGSLTDALHVARTKGRLLVVFIPASKPNPKKSKRANKNNIYDQIAIESLLGPEVASVANKKARKKEEGGSFVLWGARCGSTEANTALKKLKVKKSSDGRSPTLVVVYPSRTTDPYGKQTITPRLLAQHHCNPPPSPNTMSAWLEALRKRHVKQYAAMHHELTELRLLTERTEGYRDSLRNDKKRDERERREREEEEERVRLEEERMKALEERREGLKQSLEEMGEPERGGEGVVTVALRSTDGKKTGQRRFRDDEPLSLVFDWTDVLFGIERERVVLSMMGGSRKSFGYDEVVVEDGKDGMTLKEAGLGKMTALRVTERIVEEEEKDEGEEEEKEEDDKKKKL